MCPAENEMTFDRTSFHTLSKISLTDIQMTVIARNEAIQPALLDCFAFGSQ
jgi:hypothetical protein